MKNLLIISFFLLFANMGSAQTINGIPVADLDVDYLQIVGQSRILSTRVNIEIDFGQRGRFFSNKEYEVKDEKGINIKFNSMIDALNFFSAHNYKFVTAYAFAPEGSSTNVYHYLLRKERD